MRVILLIVCSISCFFPLQGQQQPAVDSLKKVLTRTHEAKAKVDLLNKIGWEYRKTVPDSTIVYASMAYLTAKESNYPQGICKSLSFIGVGYKYLTQLDSALVYYQQALNMAKNLSDSIEIAHGYNNIGSLYYTQRDYPQAFRYQELALEMFERANDDAGIAYAYQALARTSLSEGNIEEAIHFNQKAVDIRKEVGPSSVYVTSLLEMAGTLLKQQSYDEALASLKEARIHSEEINNDALKSMCDAGLASFYVEQKLYTNALVYANRAIAQHGHINNIYEKTKNYVLLGKIHFHLEDYSNAERYLSISLKEAQQHSIYNLEVDSYRMLALLEEARKNYRQSLDYYKRYLEGRDSIFNKEKAQEMNRLHQSVAMMRKEQELDQMRQRELRRDVTIKEERVRTWFFLGLSGMGFVFILLLIRSSQRQKHANKQLNEQKTQIEAQNLSIQQKNITLEKTNRQLSEINGEKDSLMGVVAHDLKAPLNKVKGYTQILKLLGGLSEEQSHIVDGIDKVIENGRNLIRDLLDVNAIEYTESQIHPQDLNIGQLLSEIVESYEQAAEQKSLEIIYTDTGYPVSIYSDESALLRIFDNIISNAVKFSPKGKTVSVSLHNNDNNIQVMIRDEGQGFSPEDQDKAFRKFQKLSAKPTGGESSTGLGLAIVKVLVEKIQGTIQLNSVLGEGSEFIIELPNKLQ